MMTVDAQCLYQENERQLTCSGDWDVNCIPSLQTLFKKIAWPTAGKLTIDGAAIEKMDTAGAWLLVEQETHLKKLGVSISFEKFAAPHQTLLNIVQGKWSEDHEPPVVPRPTWVQSVGIQTVNMLQGLHVYLSFIGQLSFEAWRLIKKPWRFRWSALASVIYRNGFQALPIVTLLSFMIGVVITYQMGLQLKNYGANIFIVDLLGLSILREFGPLLTSIMVAGRTGSAFTAQLGMMKINQEIDALDTMGVTPGELLLLPRLLGMLIALPLVTVWADIWGIIGGMVMANATLDITWYDFMRRFPTVIPLRALLIGVGKTPVFALLIASIGCFQGMQVGGSADSVGQNTTKSVVLSIFFIIVADAIFSVIFSELHL